MSNPITPRNRFAALQKQIQRVSRQGKALLATTAKRAARFREAVATWYRRRNTLGARGERAAARYLVWSKRMSVVEASARNIYGEIDIIAVTRCKTKVVFVEVKTRKSHDRGHPAEAVGPEKQKRITRIALAYMKRNNLLNQCSVRFDVIAITWPQTQKRPTIRHYEAAFEAVGEFQMYS